MVALASALDCREGQAYSVVVAGLLAVLLAALGIPPVLSHRPRLVAASPQTAPAPSVPGGPAASTPQPEVTGAGAPAVELPPLPLPSPAQAGAAPGSPLAAPPADAAAAGGMTGTGATLRGREGTPLLTPVPVNGQVALVSNARGRQLTGVIDWGDGTEPSKGDVSATSEDSFQVTGSHVYDEDGVYKITVTITDTAGAVLVVVSRAEVAEPPDALNKALDDAIDAAP